jgi:hypothetical protein
MESLGPLRDDMLTFKFRATRLHARLVLCQWHTICHARLSRQSCADKPGYASAHARYEEMRKFFQERAYATHGSELVVVKVTMMVQEPGRIKSVIVSV